MPHVERILQTGGVKTALTFEELFFGPGSSGVHKTKAFENELLPLRATAAVR